MMLRTTILLGLVSAAAGKLGATTMIGGAAPPCEYLTSGGTSTGTSLCTATTFLGWHCSCWKNGECNELCKRDCDQVRDRTGV